jgi:hypothetical protein
MRTSWQKDCGNKPQQAVILPDSERVYFRFFGKETYWGGNKPRNPEINSQCG